MENKKINLLRKLIRKQILTEASEMSIKDLDKTQLMMLKNLGKRFSFDLTTIKLWDGIHGRVARFESGQHGTRLNKDDLNFLSQLPIRWVECTKEDFNVGF